jgi:hypothetical protein
MRRKKPIISPALIPNKKKEMLKIINDPDKMKEVMNLVKASSNLFDKSKTMKATTILDWVERCISILPDDMENKDAFIKAFRNFIDTYGDNNTNEHSNE